MTSRALYAWLTRTEPVLNLVDFTDTNFGIRVFSGPDADARLLAETDWLASFDGTGLVASGNRDFYVVAYDACGQQTHEVDRALARASRQDPDVVMVRGADQTNAPTLSDLAQTGHCVIVSSEHPLVSQGELLLGPFVDADSLRRVPAATLLGPLPRLAPATDGAVTLTYAHDAGPSVMAPPGLGDDYMLVFETLVYDPAAATITGSGVVHRWSRVNGWRPTKKRRDAEVSASYLDSRSWRAYFDYRLGLGDPVSWDEAQSLLAGRPRGENVS